MVAKKSAKKQSNALEKPYELIKKVEKALESVRPHLQAHGGDVQLIDVKGSVAYVRLSGACNGCPAAGMTLKYGVEREIMEKVPEISRVEAVIV